MNKRSECKVGTDNFMISMCSKRKSLKMMKWCWWNQPKAPARFCFACVLGLKRKQKLSPWQIFSTTSYERTHTLWRNILVSITQCKEQLLIGHKDYAMRVCFSEAFVISNITQHFRFIPLSMRTAYIPSHKIFCYAFVHTS